MTLSAGWRLRAGTHLNWAGLVAATILLQMFLQLPELLGVVATPTAQQSPLQGKVSPSTLENGEQRFERAMMTSYCMAASVQV